MNTTTTPNLITLFQNINKVKKIRMLQVLLRLLTGNKV